MDAQLFRALAKMAQQRLGNFNAQDLTNTAWAFAKLGQFDELGYREGTIPKTKRKPVDPVPLHLKLIMVRGPGEAR